MSLPNPAAHHPCRTTILVLNRRTRSMLRTMEQIEDGMCTDLARAALLEAAAILADAAEQCEMMPLRVRAE